MPQPVGLDHDRQLGRVAALLAHPAPVARGLLRRDAALFAQQHTLAVPRQKIRRHDANHAAADDDGVAGFRQRILMIEVGQVGEREIRHVNSWML